MKTNIKNVVCVEGNKVPIAEKIRFLGKRSGLKLEFDTQILGNNRRGYRILCQGRYISGRMSCKDMRRWLDGAISIVETLSYNKRVKDAENGN